MHSAAHPRGPVIAVLTDAWEGIAAEILRRVPGADVRSRDTLGDLQPIQAAICWHAPHELLRQMPSLRLIQSTGAGVDRILDDPMTAQRVVVCRTIDAALSGNMAGYVTWAVIDHQRELKEYQGSQLRRQWAPRTVRANKSHTVGFAGVGAMGSACLRSMDSLGFKTSAWSQSRKPDLPTSCAQYSGLDQLSEFLRDCNTLVCLLPLTASTTGFLSRNLFSQLPDGAHLINVARGEHLVESDLLDAIDSGKISRATLDVFTTEPLPAAHPFWKNQRIVLTPHVAARASVEQIAEQTLTNLRLVNSGQQPWHRAEPAAGY